MRSIKQRASGYGKPCWTQKGETFEKRSCDGAGECLNQQATIFPEKKKVYGKYKKIYIISNITANNCVID